MTALAAKRDTQELASPYAMNHAKVGIDSDVFYPGAFIAFDQSDAAFKPAATATDLIAVGRCEEQEPITTGAGNTRKIKAKSGIFKWGNSAAGDAIAEDDVGKDCYLVDDQTVALTDGTGTRSKAGKVYQVDSDGVWVLTIFPGV